MRAVGILAADLSGTHDPLQVTHVEPERADAWEPYR
jgi:hypothetical protein